MVHITPKTFLLTVAGSAALVAADCNPGACAGTIAAAIGATAAAVGTCPLVPATLGGALAVCIPAVVGAEAAWATAGAICGSCDKVVECAEDDETAYARACGKGNPAAAELGPGACMQLSTSVRNPSVTDKVVEGGFTYHCANKNVVVGGTGSTCWVPCTKCERCEGVPTEE